MLARLIWRTLSPDSTTSSLGTGEGVPISAPRPFPRLDLAMRLRLPEQHHERKLQQSTPVGDLLHDLSQQISSADAARLSRVHLGPLA